MKILIVKDAGILCEAVNGALGHANYECVRASGEEEGIAAAGSASPDLIILDMESPRARGLDILLKLREKDSLKKIPIMIVSRYGTRQDKLASYAYGANRFLERPLDTRVLLDEISALLKRRPA